MPKKVRFYTEQEINLLQEFAKSKAPVNKQMLAEFCKNYKRSLHSATVKVYDFRRQFGFENSRPPRNKTINPKANLVKDKTVATMSKGEFKIPINSWNVSNENGQFYFVVKF